MPHEDSLGPIPVKETHISKICQHFLHTFIYNTNLTYITKNTYNSNNSYNIFTNASANLELI